MLYRLLGRIIGFRGLPPALVMVVCQGVRPL